MVVKKKVNWNAASTLPRVKGWYAVKRKGETEVIARPYGNGMWWTPLRDGWLGHFEPRGTYRWRSPRICCMEPAESKMMPIEEMKRALARYRDG